MAGWERENGLWRAGCTLVGGCDEVGRGPLAGPVVAAIVVFDRACLEGLADSKVLPPSRRQELNREILGRAVSIGIGVIDNRIIDEVNILNATKMAMNRAWRNLKLKPDYLLVDALEPESLAAQVRLEGIIRGDSLSAAIAAASIVAKVYRDRLMVWYHGVYPQYNFRSNKGYPTREHFLALREHGYCPLHRRTFRGVVNE